MLWSLPSSPIWGGGCCCYGLPVLLARWSFPICTLWCGGLCCSRLPFPPPLVWMVLWSFPSCPRGVEGCCCSGLPFLLVVWSCLLPRWRGGVLLFWVACSSGCVVVPFFPLWVGGFCCFGLPFHSGCVVVPFFPPVVWRVVYMMTKKVIAFVSKDDKGRLNDAIMRLLSSLKGCPTCVNTIEKCHFCVR